MSSSFINAIQKLERAVSFLEGAIALKLDSEKRKGDIELELQLMQDDRVRLAEELGGTTHRLQRIESIVKDVEERVEKTIVGIEDILATSDEGDDNDAK